MVTMEEKYIWDAPKHYDDMESVAWANGWNACREEVLKQLQHYIEIEKIRLEMDEIDISTQLLS